MAKTTRPDFCASCPIAHITTGYVPPKLGPSSELVVCGAPTQDDAYHGQPLTGGPGAWMESLCKNAHLPHKNLSIVNVIGCAPPEPDIFPGDRKWYHSNREEARAAVERCRQHHLQPVVESRPWTRILALGDAAMNATTPRNSVHIWRGSPLPLRGQMEKGPKVIPTLEPGYLGNLFSVVVGDLRKDLTLPPEHYNLWPTIQDVRAFTSKKFAFDFEWDAFGNITLCALTDRFFHGMSVPWCEPYISELKRIFEASTDLIGHNIIGADLRYIEALGWDISGARLHDTLLKQHLIQPDYRHGLGFVASVFTRKVFWKGSGEETEDDDGNILPTGPQWKTWNSPDAIPVEFGGYGGCMSGDEAFRLYNVRDNDASFQCDVPLDTTLNKYGQSKTYWNVSVPVAHICREIGDKGTLIDSSRIGVVREDLQTQILQIEQTLPPGLKPYEKEVLRQIPAPEGTYKAQVKVCKGTKKSPHNAVELTFTLPGTSTCNICYRSFTVKSLKEVKRIKVPSIEKIVPWNSSSQVMEYALGIGCKPVMNKKTKNSSADKNARKVWGREHTEFTVVDVLKKLVTQRNNFAKEGLLQQKRVHFDLKVYGTAEARLSCKGHRKGIDPNIQNQPKEFRKVYIPDDPIGGAILNSDVVQGENRLTAYIARDFERLERLKDPTFDEHGDLAASFFNCVVTKQVNEHLRKPGKVCNHGINYGMGWKTLQDNLAMEGFHYSAADVKEFIEIWKKKNPGTAAWQKQTIEQAKRQGYLENAFGRRRWFQTSSFATKALAFLPASTLADMMLRCMIAFYPEKWGGELLNLGVRMMGSIPEGWRMWNQVHDSLAFTGPRDERMHQMAHLMKTIMTQPWAELDNYQMEIDTEFSYQSWGDLKPYIPPTFERTLPLAA